MKTATITLHDTDNCGSSLQAYALQCFLSNNGIENEIIDYVPAYTKNNGRPFKTFVRKIIYHRATKKREQKFASFVHNNLKLTKMHYTTLEQLRNNPPQADCFITGSDQLWNSMYLCGRDPAFYLNFTTKKKIAYAVSVGREQIPNSNLDIIKRNAKGFHWISVRERTSVKQLDGLELKSGPVQHVCDPVLLNPVRCYEKIRGERMHQGKYILVYLAQDVDIRMLENYIQNLRNKLGAEVVFAGSYRSKCTCDYHFKDMSPSEFLSLIYYADYIVSNSFHATIFSLLYKKQFATILPLENSIRIKDLLDTLGLSDRAIAEGNTYLQKDITQSRYNEIEELLNSFRENSGNILLEKLQ